MKYRFFLFILCFYAGAVAGQRYNANLALHLDGKDNDVRIGMGIIKTPWTLEAWIKRDTNDRNKREVIFGGGEYSNLNIADNLPLDIEDGRLHCKGANLWSKNVLDNKWHHVAVTCNGAVTCLYLDGQMVGRSNIGFPILIGTLGTQDNDSTTFSGLIDEVRIWKTAIDSNTLREWMEKPLEPEHPDFKKLIGYYTFDDGMKDVGINWVGVGNQAYHLRNGRYNYKGHTSLAYTIPSNNSKFINFSGRQKLFNAVVINNEWDVDQGSRNEEMLKLRIAVRGTADALSLSKIDLDLSGVTHLSDISSIHIYYTGKTAKSTIRKEVFSRKANIERRMQILLPKKQIYLSSGINYFLVTATISPRAVVGDTLRISVPSFKLNNHLYYPISDKDPIVQTVTASSKTNPEIVKVLQWNIWHGGVHLGNDGVARVIDLIKASHADIVTMQEAYGSQKRIDDSLGYFMHSPDPKSNLAVFSRYPITAIHTRYNQFNSNPVLVTLPNKKTLLVNGCWLRYASNPEYTSIYPDRGLNPALWVHADSLLALVDIQNILEKDIKPYIHKKIPVIIGGDFNSCSHLDWTKAAAPFHYGYGPVPFPVSRYLLSKGFKDSFRELNPNETRHPEGTWAVIYGQSQYCRIDFLYYKGTGLKAVSSKIVRTPPEIDDVWPSDHAAVLTTFKNVE